MPSSTRRTSNLAQLYPFKVTNLDRADLRLLDLAISYAMDNPAIHFGDIEKIERLRSMLGQVLRQLK